MLPVAVPRRDSEIDADRGEQDEPGRDELGLDGQTQQVQAVVDRPDDKPAEEAVDRPASAAEQAGAADDRRRDGVQHQLAAVDVGGHLPVALSRR